MKQITGTVNGAANPSFTYDANGSMTSGAGRTVTWTAFNMPASIAMGSSTLSFAYDAEFNRIVQSGPYGTTFYVDALGAHAEIVIGSGGTTYAKNYISVPGGGAAGGMIAVYNQLLAGTGSNSFFYFHKDNLGSIAATTLYNGDLLEREAYDSWGKRRYPNGADDLQNAIVSVSNRGFTQHEHLEEVALVHMNGRVYDPLLGRFASADPLVQDPLNAQSFNRFSYGFNNPLAYTDPSGYFSLGGFFKGIFKSIKSIFTNPRALVTVAVTAAVTWGVGTAFIAAAEPGIATAGITGTSNTLFASAWVAIDGAAGASLTTLGSVASGAAGGFAGGMVASGGDLKAGLRGAATAGAFFGVGELTFHGSIPPNGVTYGANVAGHAIVGCTAAVLSGGRCSTGALSAGLPALAGPMIPDSWGFTGKLVANSAIGGTVSAVSGGRFANGAVTAAFGYLFNFGFEELFSQEKWATERSTATAKAYSSGLLNPEPAPTIVEDYFEAWYEMATTASLALPGAQAAAGIGKTYGPLRTFLCGLTLFCATANAPTLYDKIDIGNKIGSQFTRARRLWETRVVPEREPAITEIPRTPHER